MEDECLMKYYVLIKHMGKTIQLVFPSIEHALEYSNYFSINNKPSSIPNGNYPILNSV